MRGRRSVWAGAGLAAIVVAVLAVLALRPSPEAPPEPDVGRVVDDRVAAALEELRAQPPDSVAAYNAIRGPLVVIQSQRRGGPGLGSGVIVNAQGEILTSLHVVQDAASITVSFSDGTESPATVNSSDPDRDIALLRPARLPQVVVPAVMGGGAQIGETTFAVGHPLGLAGSLSAGVISGLDRTFRLANGKTIPGMIQFDAAVNPGNSGGPLLNRRGEVIGIVTGLANTSGDEEFIGIGFAVPISTAGGLAGAPAR